MSANSRVFERATHWRPALRARRMRRDRSALITQSRFYGGCCYLATANHQKPYGSGGGTRLTKYLNLNPTDTMDQRDSYLPAAACPFGAGLLNPALGPFPMSGHDSWGKVRLRLPGVFLGSVSQPAARGSRTCRPHQPIPRPGRRLYTPWSALRPQTLILSPARGVAPLLAPASASAIWQVDLPRRSP